MADYSMPLDELNVLRSEIETEPETLNADNAEDILLDILIMSYVYGTEAANKMLGTDIVPDYDLAEDAIYKRIEGKNFADRVRERIDAGDYQGLMLIAETDRNRVYNDAILNAAKESGKNLNKTWVTMADDKVRDTHSYLDGNTVPLDARFYTFDGDSAEYPGGFELPQNNCNCRCYILLTEA